MSEKKIDEYTLTISNGTTVTGCNVHAYGSNVIIRLSEEITKIAPYAFENCSGIRKIILPKSVERVGMCAFKDCSDLEEVFIPDTVKTLEVGIFRNCKKLRRTHIPAHIKETTTKFDKGIPSFLW